MEYILVTFFNEILALIHAVEQGAIYSMTVIALIWAIHLLNTFLGGALCAFGIIPRKIIGLLGVVFAPFLHASFSHVFFNSVPLFILLTVMLTFGLQEAVCATIFIALIGGGLVWLFGRKAIHVGASGVIMGYMGFVMYSAYYSNNLASVVVGVVSFYYLGSMLLALIPNNATESWEGHIFGLLAGVAAANFGCIWPFNLLSHYAMDKIFI